MLTKGAIGNLANRYKAVLKKCRRINVFGSLAVASMLVLGSAGMAAGAVVNEFLKTDNPPHLSGATDKDVFFYRAYKNDDTPLSDNKLTVDSGTAIYRICTARNTNSGDVHDNELVVTGGDFIINPENSTIQKKIASTSVGAGISTEGNAYRNKTYVKGIAVAEAVGALSRDSKSNPGSVWGNTLEIEDAIYIGTAMGAQVTHGSADAWNNNVIVKNSTIAFLMGAKIAEGKGNVKNNTVEIYSGDIENAYGGVSDIEGNAALNKIYMKGGNVKNLNGGYTANGNATGNTVDITGGSITGGIAGGNIDKSSNCKATGNTISISGSPDLSGATLYGGYGTGTGSDIRTGNTLDLKASGLSAQNVKNFDTMNFTVASDVKPGDTILTLNGAEKTDISDVTINVTVAPRTQPLNKGDQVCLLRNSKGIEGNFIEGELTVQQGFSANYTLALTTGTSLDFEVVDAFASPGSKSFLEGRTAMLAFVNQGAELIAERGMEAARQEALEGSLTPFLAGQGGKSRYDTGSHVDVTGFSLIAGLTSAKKTEIGTATMAAFFESGWGDYDAHNSFASAASVNADGNTRYYGGGLLAHMAFPDFGPGHAYAEASLRTGWAETGYHSGDLRDSFGNTAAYDSGSAYYGAHFGLGCEWQLSDVSALDFYAKYFWTHQEDDHVRVMSDPIHFESADSHRSRFGVRYEHEFKTDGMVVKPFLGAAYEYEYDGDVAGTAYGFAMDKPNLRGGTGAGELGVTLKSSESSAFSLNLSVQGYTGTREGVSGSFLLNYRF